MEPEESAQAAALRELKEETGLTCGSDELIFLGSICPDAGLAEGRVAFLARCAGPSIKSFVAEEIGTGRLEYFSHEALKELLNQAKNIGGATLVAGYRHLSLIADGP
jgi:8-oxo-dGTP pyrophosphatase MutT (NUDIX family)